MAFLTVHDITLFAEIEEGKAAQMIVDAEAMAVLAAPCLIDEDTELSETQSAAVKAILRGAIIRWHEAGSGALKQEAVGPYSATYDNRQVRRGMFWPSEITQLQDICGGRSASGAFGIDTVGTTTNHAEICAVNFGALYCSCGADLTNYMYPLYEV